MKKTFITIITLVISQFSLAQNKYAYQHPSSLTDGWQVSTLAQKNIDLEPIQQLFNQLKTSQHQLHSVLMVKDGDLVLEEYFDDYSNNKKHDLRSVTKSISALLMGIAIDKGFIDDVNDPISKYLKDLKPKKNLDVRKEQITIEHLLTMSTGLECNDWDKKSKGQEDRIYKKKNWLQRTLDLPMVNDPGRVANYCSMGTILAAEVIAQNGSHGAIICNTSRIINHG